MTARTHPTRNNAMTVRRHSGPRSKVGSTLTSGKRYGQRKSFPEGSAGRALLTEGLSDERLRLRWAALLLHLSPNLDGCLDELKQILLLPLC
jgi:hypothetical protein